MPHPHKGKVQSSNVAKMRAIHGSGGAGTAYGGMSSFKRANKDGEQESYNSHSKGFENGYAHGGKVKARADRMARGGRKRGEGGIANEDAIWQGASGSTKPEGKASGGRAKHKGDVNIMIMGGKPPMAGVPGARPPGAQVSPAAAGAMGVPAGGAPPGGGMPPGCLRRPTLKPKRLCRPWRAVRIHWLDWRAGLAVVNWA